MAYTIWKIILGSLNYVQCLNITSMEKVWFMAQIECSYNGKGIMALRKYSLTVNSPKGKGMVLQKIVEVVLVMVKDKKYSIKDTMSIKISFMHYM